MGLEKQLAFKEQFLNTAPAGRAALYEAKIEELRGSFALEAAAGIGEAERHDQVPNDHLATREFIIGDGYTIADMSAWSWLDRATRVIKGTEDPLAAYPNLKRLFKTVDARPAVTRARTVRQDHEFKKVNDEKTKRALFPSNYPSAA